MSEWQPIETAPKDGTPILVCRKKSSADENFGYAVVMWFEDTTDVHENYGTESAWVMDDGHDWFDYRHYTRGLRRDLAGPTHWQPLPAPPLDAESK